VKVAKQNRVTPWNSLIATPARGTRMGNRGVLHGGDGRIVRPFASRRWIICQLAFKEQKLPLMAPGFNTQLFFLDEATALSAGHRPCFYCRRERAQAFRRAWVAAHPEMAANGELPVDRLDEALHADRLTTANYRWEARQRTYPAVVDSLPDGTFVAHETHTCLVWDGRLWPWSAFGYRPPLDWPSGALVTVLTPRSTVGALAAGYRPQVNLPDVSAGL
jgi:hypothetical protein